MHIPDAFIPIWQGAIYWIIALVFIALALKWAKNELNEQKLPLVAVLQPVSLPSSPSISPFRWGQADIS